MPTPTPNRGYSRPLLSDQANIVQAVGTPLNEIDADVQGIDDRLISAESDIVSLETLTSMATPWVVVDRRRGTGTATPGGTSAWILGHLASTSQAPFVPGGFAAGNEAIRIGPPEIPERAGWTVELRVMGRFEYTGGGSPLPAGGALELMTVTVDQFGNGHGSGNVRSASLPAMFWGAGVRWVQFTFLRTGAWAATDQLAIVRMNLPALPANEPRAIVAFKDLTLSYRYVADS